MTAYNIVRFRARPGREKDLVEAEKQAIETAELTGLRKGVLVKTGERDSASSANGIASTASSTRAPP